MAVNGAVLVDVKVVVAVFVHTIAPIVVIQHAKVIARVVVDEPVRMVALVDAVDMVLLMYQTMNFPAANKKVWQAGMAKQITFIVTKDCQLACKYCYLVGKNTKERMSWAVAKQAIDYILDHEDEMREESVGLYRRRTFP